MKRGRTKSEAELIKTYEKVGGCSQRLNYKN